MGTNEDDREKYDLYTEQVVLHPAKKYKWLIRIGKLLLFAVSVIIAASLFMVFLYPVLQKRIEEKNKDKNVIISRRIITYLQIPDCRIFRYIDREGPER